MISYQKFTASEVKIAKTQNLYRLERQFKVQIGSKASVVALLAHVKGVKMKKFLALVFFYLFIPARG